MRFCLVTALFSVYLCLVPVAEGAETSQVPTVELTPNQVSPPAAPVTQATPAAPATDDDADPRDNRKKQLTPEEEMQRQIRLFDPLDQSSESQTPGSAGSQSPQGPNRDPHQDQTTDPRLSRPASIPRTSPLSPLGNDADSDGQSNAPTETAPQPLPGSIEAMQKDNQTPGFGPRVEEDASGAQTGEYTGPAVLTRAYSINTLSIPNDMKFHESLSFSEVWDSTGAIAGPNSTTSAPGSSSGASVSWSVAGQHRLNTTDMIGFAYSGNTTAYTSSGYSGANQRVALNYSHMFTRRLGLSVGTSGSLLSANYAVQNPVPEQGTSVANANLASSPTLQPYASGSKQFSTVFGLNWQQSARLSFMFSGGYSASALDGAGLVGMMGMQSQGAVNYRYSTRTTIGLYYTYSHNGYSHGFGSGDSNAGGLSYALAINRSTQIRLRAGLARTEATALSAVPVSPIVYALFHTPVAIVNYYNQTATSDLSGQLVRNLGKNMAGSVAFVRGMSPGNGQLLTSTEQSLSASFNVRLRGVYTLTFSGATTTLSAIAQTQVMSYKTEVAQFSFGRRYRSVSAFFNAGYTYLGHSSPFETPYEIHLGSGVTWNVPSLKIGPF